MKNITHLRHGCMVLLALVFASPAIGQTGCQASFTFSQAFNSLAFNFADASTSPNTITTWYWTFGDNSTSTSQNPSHTYAVTGTYQVCLTIHDVHGCTSQVCHSIVVHHPFHPHHDSIAHHLHDSIQYHSHHDSIAHHPHDSIHHHPDHLDHSTFRTQPESDNRIMEPGIYPNPFSSWATLQYELAEPADVTIEIYDMSGSRISGTVIERRAAGKHTQLLNADYLKPGIYFLKVISGYNTRVSKIIKL